MDDRHDPTFLIWIYLVPTECLKCLFSRIIGKSHIDAFSCCQWSSRGPVCPYVYMLIYLSVLSTMVLTFHMPPNDKASFKPLSTPIVFRSILPVYVVFYMWSHIQWISKLRKESLSGIFFCAYGSIASSLKPGYKCLTLLHLCYTTLLCKGIRTYCSLGSDNLWHTLCYIVVHCRLLNVTMFHVLFDALETYAITALVLRIHSHHALPGLQEWPSMDGYHFRQE